MQSSVFFSYSGKKLLSVSPSFKDMLYMYCNLVTINIFMSIKRSIAFYKKKKSATWHYLRSRVKSITKPSLETNYLKYRNSVQRSLLSGYYLLGPF